MAKPGKAKPEDESVVTGKLPPDERALTVRVLWVLALAFVLSWSLLIVGAIVMENLGRDRVSLFVDHRVQSMLALESGHPINVEIGGAPLVFQLMNQRLDEVTVTTPDVVLGEFVGDVRLVATGVPLDTSQPFERVFAQVHVAEETVSRVTSRVTNATITSVELAEPEMKLGTTVKFPAVEIFGVVITPELTFDVGIGLEPFVSDGSIAFMPTSIEFNGNTLSAEAFADAYRGAAQSILQFGAICVADQLPAALALESVEVVGNELVLGLGADNAVFSDATLAERGTCG